MRRGSDWTNGSTGTADSRSRGRGIFLLVGILLAVSMACSLPSLGQQQAPTAPATLTPLVPGATAPAGGPGLPAAQSEQQTTLAPLPPALVEVNPLPLSELAPGAAPVIYFNQPMERASVEASVQSSVSGQFEWLDDATVRFVPSQPPTEEAGLTLTINPGARAANGLTLESPVEVRYQGAGSLLPADRLPAPGAEDVNPTSAVVVTFNRPVVSLGADAATLPAAFTLEPAAQGRGEWLNTSTYIFYPQPALMGGVSYIARINPALQSAAGAPLSTEDPAALDWTFSTALPALISVQPSTEQPIELDDAFVITFNQPMDTASVQENFSLIARDGTVAAGEFTWNENATEMTFQPDDLLQRGTSYTLVLLGAALGQGGSAIGQDFAAALSTVPQFAVTQTRPAAGETLEAFGGYSTIQIDFSAPVAPGQDLKSLIRLDPPVVNLEVYSDYSSYPVFVSGFFQPSTSYTLSIGADLQDKWGATLGSPFSIRFTSQPARPMLSLPLRQIGSQAIFVPRFESSIPAFSINISRLALSRGRLTLSEYIQAEQSWEGPVEWEAKIDSSWVRLYYPERNVTESIAIPLSQSGDPLEPGLYFLDVTSTPVLDAWTNLPPSLLVVSGYQMTLKVSQRQAFVWVVNGSDLTPSSGRLVSFYNSMGQPLSTCTTDEQGACQADLPEREQRESLSEPIYAVIGAPGENDFALTSSGWYHGIANWEFGLPFTYGSVNPDIYLYTDRPIYRPGQAVQFKLAVREEDNGRYFYPDRSEVTVDVISPYDPITYQSQVLATLRLPLGPYGTATGVYTLPDDARTGMYTLQVKDADQSVYFEVAEYRKPEVDLQIAFDSTGELAGEDLQAQVTARYFFGAPAGDLPVRWSLFRRPEWQVIEGLTVGRFNANWLDPFIEFAGFETYLMEGQARTNADGTLTIDMPGSEILQRMGDSAENMQALTLEVTAEDESGLPVSARAEMRLHPSQTYIGVRPEMWNNEAGVETTFYIRTVDWQENPIADHPLNGRFRKVTWVQRPARDLSEPPEYVPEYTEIGSTAFQTSPRGEARLAFTPPEPGTYVLEVTGEDGAVSEQLIWVGGVGAALWPSTPNQRITLQADAEAYQPGQTARIFIPNPFLQGAQALVTVERGRVMRSQVITIAGASHMLEIPLTAEDAPNVFISVTLLGRTNGRPDFRAGYVELSVDPAEQVLDVEVGTSPEQAQPGEEVVINIRVHDAEGNPIQGEFSLALVDKAVLALADPNSPSIVDAFYGRQPLGVQSSLSLVAYSGRFLYIPPGRGGGGGGSDSAVQTTLRTNFEDTAFWNGNIETDVNGVAQVTVRLPDNLTTWRADVRGLTEDSLVGQAQVDLVTSKPLLVRPVTPRFVVVGDHLEMLAVVHNNTQEAVQASVRLESGGFVLDDPNTAVQPVSIPPNDRVQVGWWGTVQDMETLDLIFGVEAGALRDSTQPEGGPLPVLRYLAPQTFGTSGLLNDAGERIETVSLPRSYAPTGGGLHVELSPSLTAVVMDGLEAQEAFPRDFTEPVVSYLLPNLAMLQAVNELNLPENGLRAELLTAITESVDRLVRLQNENGGWGWAVGRESDVYISSNVLYGLNRAAQAGIFVDPNVLQRGRDYLAGSLLVPTTDLEPWQHDRLAFQLYVLQSVGTADLDFDALYTFRQQLSPWGKAFLAMSMESAVPGEARVRTLLSDLEASASRSATGASWQDPGETWRNWSSAAFTTAVVAQSIARLDPTSPLLVDSVRYLVLNRRPTGAWSSSYDTAWALTALVEAARATGDLQAAYTYGARLNGAPLVEGQVTDAMQAVTPITAVTPVTALDPAAPNPLTILRGEGSGQLYYRAYLQVSRPVEEAAPVQRGIEISRQFYRDGQDCRAQDCNPLADIDLADPQPVLVRLTLNVPEDMTYVIVEDYLPAGAEVLNPRLNTSQRNVIPLEGEEPPLPYTVENPFDEGWGWWLFNDPQVYDEKIRWVVDYLPAGTYELTYRMTPFLAGEFRLLPAHAWQHYFPEVEGMSAGSTLVIE